MRVIFAESEPLGKAIASPWDYLVTEDECSVLDLDAVVDVLSAFPIGTQVINAAIPWDAEFAETNLDARTLIVGASSNVAEACAMLKLPLVHLSSACVFAGGERLYREEDEPDATSALGLYAAEAEREALKCHRATTVARLGVCVSATPGPANVVSSLLEASSAHVGRDEVSVTFLDGLVGALHHVSWHRLYGTYHMTCRGSLSPYTIASVVRDVLHRRLEVFEAPPCSPAANVRLDVDKLSRTGFEPRAAYDALLWSVDNYH